MVSQTSVNNAIDVMADTLKNMLSKIDVQDLSTFSMSSSSSGECTVSLYTRDTPHEDASCTKVVSSTYYKNLGHLW